VKSKGVFKYAKFFCSTACSNKDEKAVKEVDKQINWGGFGFTSTQPA
jgi:hypothetical protein